MATIRGGDKFYAKMRELAALANKPGSLRVGFLENATYPGGTPVAMIAAIQNFGAPRAGIPPRPFLSNMIKDKQGEWPDAIAGVLASSNYDVELTLKTVGAVIAGQLRQSIIDTNSPALAPSTIAARGGAPSAKVQALFKSYGIANGGTEKPLVDTGHLLQSVDYEVNT